MIQNAMCYNNTLTVEYFENKTLSEVYAFNHPAERHVFNKKHKDMFGHPIEAIENQHS